MNGGGARVIFFTHSGTQSERQNSVGGETIKNITQGVTRQHCDIYLQMHRTHKAEKHRLWKSSQTRGGCRQKQFSSVITIETQCAFFTRNKTTNEILSNTGVTGGK
jgi:hypothetical protein